MQRTWMALAVPAAGLLLWLAGTRNDVAGGGSPSPATVERVAGDPSPLVAPVAGGGAGQPRGAARAPASSTHPAAGMPHGPMAPWPHGQSGRSPLIGQVVAGRPELAADLDSFGEVDVGRCMAVIAEYRDATGLPVTTARYHMLLLRANQRLAAAAQRVAKEQGIRLVVEKGGIDRGLAGRSGRAPHVVDLTGQILDFLQER